MKMIYASLFAGLGLIMVVGCASTAGRTIVSDSIWTLDKTPLERTAGQFEISTAEHLAWASAWRARIDEVEGPRTIQNTLESYNEMLMHLEASASECDLFSHTHPDEAVRKAAVDGKLAVAEYMTKLSLDRGLYDALADMDLSDADAATRFLVEKVLREFRRAGVDRDEETRQRVATLKDEIVKIGVTFARNIDEDNREILLDSPADLAGMPEDWIKAHAPDANGKIHVTTAYPDFYPFVTYALNAEARKALYTEFKNRAYPANVDVLHELTSKRDELAKLLGYATYADYDTEVKMIGSAAHAQAFIDRISDAAKGAIQRDYAMLLERKQQDQPNATEVGDWEKTYYEELVRSDKYAFDAQSIRPYFNFSDVQRGLFDLTQEMFGVSYREVTGLNLWDDKVTAWDVYDDDTMLGRFYLDLHPRENKYRHAACFGYREGIAGKRLPQAVLVCNFPDPTKTDNGVALMEHNEVVVFFHEFGHLLHSIFAGHRKWMGNSGINTEWDFVEAPSQILEEWCYNREALQLFARHFETGETIPDDLVAQLRKASEFGKGIQVGHQMFYAALALNYYGTQAADLDINQTAVDLQKQYSPFPCVEGTHFQCSFGHLNHYAASYYTYMWSKVIAKDMFSRFEEEGVLNPKTTQRYRDTILKPGGSKKAAELVEDFLGRPYSFEAFESWLNRS